MSRFSVECQGLLMAALMSLGSSGLLAQARPATLSGTVQDSAANPLAAVEVMLQGRGRRTATDEVGRFRFDSLPPGQYAIAFYQPGFRPLLLQVTVTADLADEISVGAVVLGAVPSRAIALAGTVRDATAGGPIDAVAVLLNGRVVGFSDPRGRFSLSGLTVRAGDLVGFRRIGYRPVQFDLWPAQGQDSVRMAVRLEPVAVQLGEVVVEGNRAIVLRPWMRDFERHRREGFGRFLTEEQIARYPSLSAVDLLRWVGVSVTGDLWSGGQWVKLFGVPPACGAPVFFIDGVRYDPETAVFWLEVTAPEDVIGVEIYNHIGGIPVEYNATNAECGVIAVWRKR